MEPKKTEGVMKKTKNKNRDDKNKQSGREIHEVSPGGQLFCCAVFSLGMKNTKQQTCLPFTQ